MAVKFEQHGKQLKQKSQSLGLGLAVETADGKDGETKEQARQNVERKIMPMFVGIGEMVTRGFDIQHSVLLQGYLTKQSIKGRFGKKWTKRWFVLHGHTLYYFKSE